MPDIAIADSDSASAAHSVRRLGRFELRRLLGRSAGCMAWRVGDPRSGQELVLVLPRRQPADSAALQGWLEQTRRATRLTHPNLAHAVEVGEQDHWPYVAYDSAIGLTLVEPSAIRDTGIATDIARWMAQALAGLAFAHDAGFAHHDVQPFLLALADNGALRVMGLEVAAADGGPEQSSGGSAQLGQALVQSRGAAERDVLALALVMHGLLAAAPALGEHDVAAMIARLPPLGRDALRLPWDLPRPVPDVLRAIVNRATDRQPRQRYRNARTLVRALEGWLESDGQQGHDAHAQLIERVRQVGVLPALPGGAVYAARLALTERGHSEELAQAVLCDPALTFELLKTVNSAQVRGTQVSGNGPVLTVRRAIAMVGRDGVRRSALGLRDWPGPLDAAGAHELEHAIGRALRAARVALLLRPAGYDAEVVSLITLMQNLGRLVVRYHFPDETRQLRRLMQALPATVSGQTHEAGMSEQAAAFAVFGSDVESMGAAVARWWGMDDAVLHMIRRLPPLLPVRHADSDGDMLRAVASAANEAIDALDLPIPQRSAAIERVAQRYARALNVGVGDIQAALQASASVDPGLESPEPPEATDPQAT